MQSILTRFTFLFAAAAVLFAASCKRSDEGSGITPVGGAPVWGPTISREMLAVIEELDSIQAAPLYTLTPQQARAEKSIFDAARNITSRFGIQNPLYTVDITDQIVTLNGASISLRIYRPQTGVGPFPGILYFHGGGWVVATNQTYDASAAAIAEGTGSVLINVEYRKGPENKFPTAHNDAFAAYQWMLANAATYRIDPNRIAVAGESAGANLACNVSIAARNASITMPKHQLLIYPVAQNDTATASYNQYAAAQPLSRPLVNYFLKNYLSTPAQSADPRISLVNANLSNLPPTTIINAEIDPLRDDGLMLEAKLKAHGIAVTRRLFDGVTHEFFGLTAILPQAREAQGVAHAELRHSLGQ